MSQWLRTQSDSIRPATPNGLQVREALGIQHYHWERNGRNERTGAPRKKNTALYMVVLIIILCAAGFFIYQQRQNHEGFITNSSTDTTTTVVKDTVPAR